MSLKDDLIAAKALIDSPEKWACCASDRHRGNLLDAVDACERVTRDFQLTRYLRAQLPDPFGTVTAYNNAPDTTHADIMALFDRAIEAAS